MGPAAVSSSCVGVVGDDTAGEEAEVMFVSVRVLVSEPALVVVASWWPRGRSTTSTGPVWPSAARARSW